MIGDFSLAAVGQSYCLFQLSFPFFRSPSIQLDEMWDWEDARVGVGCTPPEECKRLLAKQKLQKAQEELAVRGGHSKKKDEKSSKSFRFRWDSLELCHSWNKKYEWDTFQHSITNFSGATSFVERCVFAAAAGR